MSQQPERPGNGGLWIVAAVAVFVILVSAHAWYGQANVAWAEIEVAAAYSIASVFLLGALVLVTKKMVTTNQQLVEINQSLQEITTEQEHRRRAEQESSKYAKAVEKFLAPAIDVMLSIQASAEPQHVDRGQALRKQAESLRHLWLHGTQHAYKIPEDVINDLWRVGDTAMSVVNQVSSLRDRQMKILSDVGSKLNGETGRPDPPTVVVYQNGKRLADLKADQLLVPWLDRIRFHDYVRSLNDEYDSAAPIEVKIHHGTTKVHDGPDFASLRKLIHNRLQEEPDLFSLPTVIRQFQVKCVTMVDSLSQLRSDYIRHATESLRAGRPFDS